jgi:serine/threonine protein kinase
VQVYEGDTLHDLYDSHEMIGTGKFSIVYRCTSKATSKSFALKDINTEKLTNQAIAILDNESEIMKVISHPQIVKYQ